MSERCMMYVDGYNFYYSIKRHPDKTPIHLGWCNFAALANQFMLPAGASLVGIRYFTARVERFGASGGPMGSEEARQQVWLRALNSIPGLEIIEGYHTGEVGSPRGRKEKETDVNIAVAAIVDAARDRFDRALLLTGDRDQRPTVRAVAEEFRKRADVWITPNQAVGFWKAAEGYAGVRVRTITSQMLHQSRLSERLEVGGQVVEAPRLWRAPGR
jgi:uncharacterized LabA/DUF88 family protein